MALMRNKYGVPGMLTPAVVLRALRDVNSRHRHPPTLHRRLPLAQRLIASQTGHLRGSEHERRRLYWRDRLTASRMPGIYPDTAAQPHAWEVSQYPARTGVLAVVPATGWAEYVPDSVEGWAALS